MPKAASEKTKKSQKKVTFDADVEKREIMREARRVKLEELGDDSVMLAQGKGKPADTIESTPSQTEVVPRSILKVSESNASADASQKSTDKIVKEETMDISISKNRKPRRCSDKPDVKLRRLKSIPDVLKELHVIWEKDKRVPTSESRRRWAYARGVQPKLVGCWFDSRKRKGKASEGTYELDIDAPHNENKENAEERNAEHCSVSKISLDDCQQLAVQRTTSVRSTTQLCLQPSTPPLSFSPTSSPKSSSPLPLPLIPAPLVAVDHISTKQKPSMRSSCQGRNISMRSGPWGLLHSRPEVLHLRPIDVVPPFEFRVPRLRTRRPKDLFTLASEADARRNRPMDLQDLVYAAEGECLPKICSASSRFSKDDHSHFICALCTTHDMKTGFMGTQDKKKNSDIDCNVTYSLPSQAGILRPLYDVCAQNPLLCDTIDHQQQFNRDIEYWSYESMELSGIPFWDFVSNLPSNILDPVDSMPTWCRRLQLIKESLSEPMSLDATDQQKAYSKQLAQELELVLPFAL